MNRTDALGRGAGKFVASGLVASDVSGLVGQLDRLLIDSQEEQVVPAPETGVTLATLPAGVTTEEADALMVDLVIAYVLREAPQHAFRSRQAFNLRFTPLRFRGQSLPGYPTADREQPTLEQALGMVAPTHQVDDLSRRLGRTE